jgi:endonuclease/exonuclease/phosphatase (EEP) superfamily protein YafD
MLVDRLLLLLLVGLAVALIASLFGASHWVLELFTHFRVQYLVVGSLAFIGCIVRGHRLAAVVAVCLVAPHAWLVGPYLLAGSSPANASDTVSPRISVMLLNLGFRNTRFDDVVALVKASAPDVVVLAEMNSAWASALEPARSEFGWHAGEKREGPFGLEIWSRFPLDNVGITDLGLPGSVHVMTRVSAPGGQFELAAVHLVPPITQSQAVAQRGQLSKLAETLANRSDTGRTVVAGDMNLTTWSTAYRALAAETGLRDATRSAGLRYTWPSAFWPLAIAIDHCLIAGDVTAESVLVGADIGSDHRPVICGLRLTGNSKTTGPV